MAERAEAEDRRFFQEEMQQEEADHMSMGGSLMSHQVKPQNPFPPPVRGRIKSPTNIRSARPRDTTSPFKMTLRRDRKAVNVPQYVEDDDSVVE